VTYTGDPVGVGVVPPSDERPPFAFPSPEPHAINAVLTASRQIDVSFVYTGIRSSESCGDMNPS